MSTITSKPAGDLEVGDRIRLAERLEQGHVYTVTHVQPYGLMGTLRAFSLHETAKSFYTTRTFNVTTPVAVVGG